MNYSNLTRLHFDDPVCAGVLSGAGVRRGMAGARAQGVWVQFDVRIGARNQELIVEAARFLAYGCPHVIAVADWVARQAVGGPAEPVLPEGVQALRERFEVPIEKLGRLLIVEDAWIAALSSPHREASV
ncbi:MAG TPA: iron-sulfur cluster assembly scaffold protein [Steroidobacteraceae bacterium]|nr:iron-sulfur cluster assembly scaffold protein [Steroidobacteraceae bacterium]